MKVLALLVFFFTQSVEAKVFDYNRAPIATFMSGSYGTSNADDSAYADAVGTDPHYDKGYQYGISGEAGVIFHFERVNFFVSAQYLRPIPVAAEGFNSQGTQLLSVGSTIDAFIPSAGFEIIIRRRPHSHLFMGFAGGYAMVSVTNDYTLTARGETTYTRVAKIHEEKMTGFGVEGRSYLGFEFLMSDNVTFDFMAGYRYLNIENLTYNAATTTVNGDVNAGGVVRNSDGSSRTLDLGGGFATIGLRWYFL